MFSGRSRLELRLLFLSRCRQGRLGDRSDALPGVGTDDAEAGLGMGGGFRRLDDCRSRQNEFVSAVDAAEGGGDGEAGTDADAKGETLARRRIEIRDRVLDLERASRRRPRRMIERIAVVFDRPEREERVAGELDDVAAAIGDRGDEPSKVRIEDLRQLFDSLSAPSGFATFSAGVL